MNEPVDRDAYADGFARVLATMADQPSWLNATRRMAFTSFVDDGWPTTKEEDWRLTDVSPLTRTLLLPRPSSDDVALDAFDARLLAIGATSRHRLVFVDGHYQPRLSARHPQDVGDGLVVAPLSAVLAKDEVPLARVLHQLLRDQNAFIALNTAFMADGAWIRIPPGLVLDEPIVLVYLASSAESASFPRTVVWAGENSQASIVELHLGADGAMTTANTATEIMLEAHAKLRHMTLQKAAPTAFHLAHLAVEQKAESEFSARSLSLGGRLVRNDVHALLAGEGCVCHLDGLYLAAGTNHVDNHTTIDHRAPRSTSREIYRGVAQGRSRAVFSGRIVIRPGAQQTDARQTNRNLVLSDGATVHTKPFLEIFANDVKCSHGATTGRLDPDALFYLRSRGIGEKEAAQILIRAFMTESLDGIEPTSLRGEVETAVASTIAGLVAEDAHHDGSQPAR
jgi:Fe-S cluster assembly protein SufD